MSLFMLSFRLQAVAYQIQNYEARLPSTPLPSDSLPVFYLKGRTAIRNTVECVPTAFPTLQENEKDISKGAMAWQQERGAAATCALPPSLGDVRHTSALWELHSLLCSVQTRTSFLILVKPSGTGEETILPTEKQKDAFSPQAAKSTEGC